VGVSIRPIEPEDAEAAAHLSAELGYPIEVETMRERIATRRRDGANSAAFVAIREGTVVGWIDVAIGQHLASGYYVEIGGLIVSSQCRNQRIGAQLVARGERWAAEKGLGKVIVRSRSTRESAHRFYLREGYSLQKTSAVFSKELLR
jgi:predicted N-acetyltransferase YhbS